MPESDQDHTAAIVEHSRQAYASKREEVEDAIKRAQLGGQEPAPSATGAPQEHQSVREQNPNSFLAGLKNPDTPSRPHSDGQGRRDGGGGHNRNRDRDRNRSGQGSHRNQHRQPKSEHKAGEEVSLRK